MASQVSQVPVPDWALLKTFKGGARPEAWGAYLDCFSVAVDRPVFLPEFVFAFYTSPVFRVERWILAALVRKPSTDTQARELGAGVGGRERFAAWSVSQRTQTQILLTDFLEQTRSWLAVAPTGTAEHPRTILHFGSAVAVSANTDSGSRSKPQMGLAFRWLTGFHILYSRILLRAARRRLEDLAR